MTSFCASCGRQRDETARFCAGCGAEYSDLAASADGAATQDPHVNVKHTEVAPGVTRVEPPTEPPDPFASWYQRDAQAAGNDEGSTWQPTQTVNAAPGQGGYEPSGFTAANPFSSANPVIRPPAPFPPAGPPGGPPPAGPPPGGGRRGLFMVLAVIVVLAAGGGAYALATTLGKHSPGQPNAGASTPASGSPTASSATGGATQQASSPAASASATPSPSLSLVAISPSVPASAAQPQVETLLSHYFQGINTHSYAEYSATLNPAEQAKQTQSEFNSGYSSTTDSGMTLTSLSDTGNGGLTATVAFTSRQSPAQSIDKSACNTWTLNLYLESQAGGGYLIGPAPSGYQPTHADC